MCRGPDAPRGNATRASPWFAAEDPSRSPQRCTSVGSTTGEAVSVIADPIHPFDVPVTAPPFR
jgi:hypothetical protein